MRAVAFFETRAELKVLQKWSAANEFQPTLVAITPEADYFFSFGEEVNRFYFP